MHSDTCAKPDTLASCFCLSFNELHQLLCFAATKVMTFKTRLDTLEGRALKPAELAAMWKTEVRLNGMSEASTEACIIACNTVHDHIFRHPVLRSKALERMPHWGQSTPGTQSTSWKLLPEKPNQLMAVPAPSGPSLRIARALRCTTILQLRFHSTLGHITTCKLQRQTRSMTTEVPGSSTASLT